MSDSPTLHGPPLTGDQRQLLEWASVAHRDVEELDRKIQLAKRVYVPLGLLLPLLLFVVAQLLKPSLAAHPWIARGAFWSMVALDMLWGRAVVRGFSQHTERWLKRKHLRNLDRIKFETQFLSSVRKSAAR